MKKLTLFLSFLFVISCSKDPVIYTLTTSANPTDGGTVSPSTQQFEEGFTATITATASSEYVFQSWSGTTGSTNSTSVVMNSDKSVTANFVKKKYALTTTVEGEGTVTEKVIKAGAATDYNSGTILELTAVPSEEWLFVEWKGDVTGTENPTQITIDKAKNVTAVFIKKQYPLTIEIEGEGRVSEKVIKAGAATDYKSGTVVELTAIPIDGWEFTEWTGDLTGTDNPSEITIDASKSIKAEFVKKPVAYLADNGVTIKANSWALVGEREEIKGVTYTVVDLSTLKTMISIGEDVTKVITSKIVNMENLFRDKTDFNQEISSWDVGNVTNMQYMFLNATSFNQDISNWNTWKVTTMRSMFNSASAFNQDIGNWDVGRVRNFRAMFAGTNHPVIFNQDINSWNTISANRTDLMFYKSVFNKPIGDWRVNNVTTMQGMFADTKFNQDIGNWNVSNVFDMSYMFDTSDFNQDIGKWDVSRVGNMHGMFWIASNFNQDINSWNVENVSNMNDMFHEATSFNQDIGGWNVSNVTSMDKMFAGAAAFNQDIGGWNVSNVATMNRMFVSAATFNQDIGGWNVSNVKNMDLMFFEAATFNQELSNWCVTYFTSEPAKFSSSSPLTEGNKPVWGTCPGNSYGIAVTASSNSDYTLSGEDRNGDVSGNDPNLTFRVGDEITFSVNAANHPFYLKKQAGTGTGNQIIISVTNNGTTNGNVVWIPNKTGDYYYQCSEHEGMVGTITIE